MRPESTICSRSESPRFLMTSVSICPNVALQTCPDPRGRTIFKENIISFGECKYRSFIDEVSLSRTYLRVDLHLGVPLFLSKNMATLCSSEDWTSDVEVRFEVADITMVLALGLGEHPINAHQSVTSALATLAHVRDHMLYSASWLLRWMCHGYADNKIGCYQTGWPTCLGFRCRENLSLWRNSWA